MSRRRDWTGCPDCPALVAVAAKVVTLEERLTKLEGKRRKIGFAVDDVRGSAVQQHDEDAEESEIVVLHGRRA